MGSNGVTRMPWWFHERRRDLVAPMPIDPLGGWGPTPGQARGPGWQRVSHGLHLPWWVDVTSTDQRIVDAAAVLPVYGAVTGWAALRWQGARWFTGMRADGSARPVTVAATRIRPQSGFVRSEERLNAREIIVHDGLRITRSLRSTLFEMRYAPTVWDAVIVADMAAYSDLVSRDELWPYALAHGGMTGIPQARDALPHLDENSWSPMEVVMRLTWTLVAGLPRPLMNQPVFDLQGRHVGTPDLLDVESGTYGEYDSHLHLPAGQRLVDSRRADALARVGLEPFVMISGQSRDEAAARMVAARERALRFARPRSWTIEQPDWWVPTETVAQRRALSDEQRARLLRLRAA